MIWLGLRDIYERRKNWNNMIRIKEYLDDEKELKL